MTCNDHLSVALAYALQWLVLPLGWITEEGFRGCWQGEDCHRPGKHPLCKAGFHDASRDEAIIRAWWARWPQANLGVRTGRESGLLVLDVDPRNGGRESMSKLQSRHGTLPDTPLCATGGDGLHYYLQYPGPIPLRGKISDLRHTYASLLLMDHYSPAYAQKQLGHHSISMTVDIYGHWIPGEGEKDLTETLRGPRRLGPILSVASSRKVG